MAANSLLKTTGIYFIGNFASRLLMFFLLPLYTAYLSTSDYGVVDLLMSILPLIGPVFTLQATESIFRFLFDKKTNAEKKICISSSLTIMLSGFLFFLVLYFGLGIYQKLMYGMLFAVYFIVSYFGTFAQQVSRGLGYSNAYAVSGVVSTIISAAVNIALIVGAGFGGDALLIAAIVSSAAVFVFLSAWIRLPKYISVKSVRKSEIVEQIQYGAPLIPNQICWWALSLMGKYVVLIYWGSSASGVLAFAVIFPNIITIITQIFFLAWVESAIRSFQRKESGKYYSDAFRVFLPLVFSIAAVLIPFVNLYTSLAIGADFQEGVQYVPVLMLASVFNCFATFLGSVYTAAKKTSQAFSTTIIAALVNVIFSFLLIPQFGILGYALASLLCYVVFFIVRIPSIRQFIDFSFSYRQLLFGLVFFGVISIASYFVGFFGYAVLFLISCLVSVFWNRAFLQMLLKKLSRLCIR